MASTMEKVMDMNEEFWDTSLDRLAEAKKWCEQSLRENSSWRLHLALYLLTAAGSFGSPLAYPALLYSMEGDQVQRLQDVNTVWISGFSITSVISALCTVVWFTAADTVSRKKLLIIVVLLKALYFFTMGILLSGYFGRWSAGLWYAASAFEGLSPSQVINVEYCMWLDFTEGSEELRSNSFALTGVFSALAAGFGTGFSIFFVQLGLLPQVLPFFWVYLVLAGGCSASACVLVGLQIPKGKEKPPFSVSTMVQLGREMLSVFGDEYSFWAIVTHCLRAACSFRSMVIPTFCMLHYGWSQEEYMLMMAIPAMGFCFSPLVPTLSRLMGETFFYLYMEFLNFLFYDVGSILYPLGSEIYIIQAVLTMPIDSWSSVLQQDVLSRVPYNAPQVRGRSAALFTGLTKVVSGITSPLLARTFNARSQTFSGQALPFMVCAGISLVIRIIHLWKMWATEASILEAIYYERRPWLGAEYENARGGADTPAASNAGKKPAKAKKAD